MMNKKGALNLSIQAIVIVVIAFVVLGLGLGFVRTQFESIGSTSTAVQEQISQQILDDLRTGNKRLSFPATKIVVETSDESEQAIGLKNTDPQSGDFEITFQVKATCVIGGTQVGEFCEFTSEEELTLLKGQQETNAIIVWDNTPQNLGPGKHRVMPVSIQAPDFDGTYLYKIVMYRLDGSGTREVDPYDTRTFFVKTS